MFVENAASDHPNPKPDLIGLESLPIRFASPVNGHGLQELHNVLTGWAYGISRKGPPKGALYENYRKTFRIGFSRNGDGFIMLHGALSSYEFSVVFFNFLICSIMSDNALIISL